MTDQGYREYDDVKEGKEETGRKEGRRPKGEERQ
jgi:hypothetical protein